MSAKSKKIISKLGKKEKEMFSTMVDMLGFDQVMSDYKRDKKAFKQALKDMSESVITEKMSVKSSKDYIDNLTQAIDLIVRQANNLKGALAKHPIKRDANKLKAVKTMLTRAILPAMLRYEKENSVEKGYNGVDLTILKKKLQDGQFKYAIQYSLLPALDTRGYDSNSFYALNNTKEDKLRERLVKVLRGLVNKMDDAQLENINEKKKMFPPKKMTPKQAKEYKKFIGYAKMGVEYQIDMSLFESINEDGHTDVASSKRKVMIMVQDSNTLLNKLNGMNKEDSLPSWWTDKITLSQNYLQKATDYITNPAESINENRDFEKLYNLFTKKDYFNLKNSIKQMLRNYDVALKKGDKGAQKYTKQDVIKSVTAQNKANAKRVYDELVTAIKKKDIRRLKSRLRYNQPYSLAIFNQITGKKLPKTNSGIHSFLDNEFMKESVKESMNPSAVKKMRDEFEKTGELPPHLKKFAKDLNAMKKKHKVKNIVVPGLEWMSDIKESVNEARLDPQQLLQQLGGNRFIMMVGAKNLVVDKSKNELHMKIGRNAKGVSHVRIRLSSMDLYDMEFLQVRAGKIKIKSKEKGVYADQLGKMFKKNTGMNVRL